MTIGDWTLANPAGLWWWLLALPVLAFHILRPRRVQATVAAIYLWRQVTRPVSAATPWQRLIPSWLLAAQLLAVLLLGLLMARPVRLTDALLAEHTVFVLDASASMQSFDGDPDRMALARERAKELRAQLPEGGEATVIVAGSRARALLTNSTDADAFAAAVDGIQADDTTGDFAAAFALAAGLDTGERDTRTVFISDGGIAPADLRAAPVGTQYEAVGSSATNRGITQLTIEPASAGLLARLTVAHFGGPAVTQDVRLDVDGVTVVGQTIELEPGGVANLSFPVPQGELFEAFLEGEDALALDDRAVATVSTRSAIDVLWVGPDDSFIAAALAASPAVEVTRAETVPAEIDADVDVVVAAGVAVPDTVDLPLLAIAPTGTVRGITPTGTVEQPVVALVDGNDPLLTGLDLSELFVAEAARVTTPPGAEVLLGAEGAPLLVRLDDPAPTVYLAFDLAASTLPLDIAFPVLFDRALGSLSGAVTPPARLVVGDDLPVDPRFEATITAPDGASETIAPGSAFPTADRIGFWRVAQDGRDVITVAVGTDRGESAVAPAVDLPFEAAFGDADAVRDRGQVPWLWPVVVVLLAVLVAEYLLARRRVGVGPRQWRAAVVLRVAVAAAVLLALLAPSFDRSADDVATVFLVDASDSMTAAGRSRAVGVVSEALATQPDDTRAGVVVFGNDARLETLIAEDPSFDGVSVQVDVAGTDLAAALRLGAATLPNDARGRLVLLSDGRPTTGDAAAEIDRLAADGIPVDVIVVEPAAGSDVAVAGIDVPSVARQGEQVSIDVRLVAPAAGPAEITLRRGDEVIDTRTVDLDAGTNTVRFTDTATADGVLRYQVDVSGPGDVVAANDIGFAAVPVQGADRVLLVEGSGTTAAGAGAREAMAATLEAGGLTVDVVSPASFPALDELTRYSSVMLLDVDRRDLSDGQVSALAASVRDLGRGLVVVGGTRSYALGSYRNTDLEELLPVISEITDPLRRQSVAEVLAIDSSGSMGACHCDEEGQNGLGGGNRVDGGVSKTAIARTAAAEAIAALAATDEVGVLTMDASDRWVIDLQASPDQATIEDGLSQIAPNGPTFVDTGLLTAAEALRESDASLKHIIFFSDGFTEPGALFTVEEQAAQLAAEGITVSVVATGEGAADDLRPIAEAGGGRYYPGRNLQQIPELIVNEAVLASRDFVNEGEFFPVITSNRATVQSLTSSPALLGYVATSAKPTATVDLRIGPDEDPLLASWRPGLGRVTAWTSDGGERWAAPWDSWAGSPDFWAAVVKDTFPVAGDGGGVQARIVDGRLELAVEGVDDWPDDATARVSVAAPDGSSTVVELERISGDTFAATVPAGDAGTYAVGATVTDGAEAAWSGVGLTTRSYPAEYAPREVGRAPLEGLAAVSGGRVDPTSTQMFDAIGTRPGTRRFELRPWLLLFAVLAWPVAVGLSRLAWRRGALAVGAERASGTVAQLRGRLPRLAEPDLRGAATPPGAASTPPTGTAPAASSPSTTRSASPPSTTAAGPATPHGPGPRGVSADGPAEGASGTAAEPEVPSSPSSTSSPDEPGESGVESTLSALLERKRRRG